MLLCPFYSSAFFVPAAPSSFANVGGTLPEIVIESAEQRKRPDSSGPHPYQNSDSGPFFWVDELGQTSSQAILDRYIRYFPPTNVSRTQNPHPFSLLTWNTLAQPLYDIRVVQKCAANQQVYKYSWEQRLDWILETLKNADADVVCLQEVEFHVFDKDLLPAMQRLGYDGAVQGGLGVQEIKRRKGKGERAHVVATFWKTNRFDILNVTAYKNTDSALLARGRTLTSVLQDKAQGSSILAVINCHLEGHPRQYAARIRQLQHAMEDLTKRCCNVPLNGLCIAGDFNCELQSSACSTYLRIGRIGRKGGLGGVHGTSALAIPPSLLLSDEAAACLGPILEWGRPIPNEEIEGIPPHPLRRNSLLSAYPAFLGQEDPTQHFTFCANPNRPVAGLDQIWFSGFSLTRIGLRKPVPSHIERTNVLATGLPAPFYPSDHLPIGAVLDWNACDPVNCALDSNPRNKCTDTGVRELIITQNQAPPTPKALSPIMAYAELDMLLVSCQFDSEKQRIELEDIVEDVPDLPSNNKKPSPEQLCKLSEMRERKKVLLANASERARKDIQRILKLKKEVMAYESSC